MTANGKIILDIVNQSQEHLTAEQIYLKVLADGRKMSMATVYNNLNALCKAGAIRRISMESQPEHYDRVARHDHLICSECGKISDLMLSDITEELEKMSGITIGSYDLKLFYLCDECKEHLKKRRPAT